MRRLASPLLALAMVVVGHLASPQPVAACSCAAPIDSIELAVRDPDATILTATTGPTIGDEMQVVVTRWFHGQPISGVAAIEVLLGDSAMCGMTPLPAGREYLFQTYPSETSRHALSGCSPQVDLSTVDGQALLAQTIDLYGGGAPPSTAAPPAGGETAAPLPAQPAPDGIVDTLIGAAIPLTLIAAFALGLIAGLALILRRRRDGG